MSRNRWLTPGASAPGDFYCRALLIPKNGDWLAIVMGALDDLTKSWNFEQLAGIPPDEAASTFAAMYDTIRDCSMIGQIIAYATTSSPTGTLACDGSTFLRTDYPALYAAIDVAYHIDADHFRTPDLRGRGVIGAGQGTGLTNRTIAESIGEEKHTLTTSELAVHAHGYFFQGTSLPFTPGEVPALVNLPGFNSTENEGAGQSHNNMQPSHVLKFAIYYT